MKLLTVKDYAKKVGKSVPCIYKQIAENRVKYEFKFGRLLIVVK